MPDAAGPTVHGSRAMGIVCVSGSTTSDAWPAWHADIIVAGLGFMQHAAAKACLQCWVMLSGMPCESQSSCSMYSDASRDALLLREEHSTKPAQVLKCVGNNLVHCILIALADHDWWHALSEQA